MFLDKLTLPLGQYFGVPLYWHWSTSIFMLVLMFVSPTLMVIMSMVYAFVILHEYGHIVAAIARGKSCCKVTIYPIGGLAEVDMKQFSNMDEFFITLCGPLVNLVWAILLIPVFVLFNSLELIYPAMVAVLAIYINLALLVFNMLPAWPLDGGRLFRAVLTFFMNKHIANSITIATSIGLAVAFIVFGLATSNLNIILVMSIVLVLAWQEKVRFQKIAVLEMIQDGARDALANDFDKVLKRLDKLKEPQDIGRYVMLVNNCNKVDQAKLQQFLSQPAPDCEIPLTDMLVDIVKGQCPFVDNVYLAMRENKPPIEIYRAIHMIPEEAIRKGMAAEWRRLYPGVAAEWNRLYPELVEK